MRPFILVASLGAVGLAVLGAITVTNGFMHFGDHDHADDALAHLHGLDRAYGEPGDGNKPFRTIEIGMRETHDGGMYFAPHVVTVRVGEQVQFVIKNDGDFAHEFVLATERENLLHAEEMRRNPDMEHDDPNALRLAATERGELLWRFTKAGTFDFSCLIPGHREAGMHGQIVAR